MIPVRGTRLYVEDSGETDLPPVVALHSLFLDGRMFDEFAEKSKGEFRVIRPDYRGQGRSEGWEENAICMDTLSRDFEALVEQLDVAPAHFVVQSMGGDVALRLAADRLHIFRSLVILGSSAREEPANQLQQFRQWVDNVAESGFVGENLETTMQIMFGETTRADPAQAEMLDLWRERIGAVPPALRPAMAGVIERGSVVTRLPGITVPTLVISGEEDLPRPQEWVQEMADGLPNSELVLLPETGHSVILETPDTVIERVLSFLRRVEEERS